MLYGYGSYGYPLGNGFSSAKYSLIDRGIIWANAHIRGGMECGMQWWKNGKMLKKKISEWVLPVACLWKALVNLGRVLCSHLEPPNSHTVQNLQKETTQIQEFIDL